MIQRMIFLFCFLGLINFIAADKCPDNLDCPEACCPNQGTNSYFCCSRTNDQDRVYLVGMGSFWKDYWAVFVGVLIAGLVLSIICSVLCCLYCNGCLWHRRRHPDLYSGAFPLGTIIYSPYCGPPPHPHGHHPPAYYDDTSPDSSIRSGASVGMGTNRKGVRFDNDTMVKTYDNTPRSALKKPSPNGGVQGGRNSPNLLL